jgi:hypothetical protein
MASSTERNRKRRQRIARENQVRTFGVDLATLPHLDAIMDAIAVSPGRVVESSQGLEARAQC